MLNLDINAPIGANGLANTFKAMQDHYVCKVLITQKGVVKLYTSYRALFWTIAELEVKTYGEVRVILNKAVKTLSLSRRNLNKSVGSAAIQNMRAILNGEVVPSTPSQLVDNGGHFTNEDDDGRFNGLFGSETSIAIEEMVAGTPVVPVTKSRAPRRSPEVIAAEKEAKAARKAAKLAKAA